MTEGADSRASAAMVPVRTEIDALAIARGKTGIAHEPTHAGLTDWSAVSCRCTALGADPTVLRIDIQSNTSPIAPRIANIATNFADSTLTNWRAMSRSGTHRSARSTIGRIARCVQARTATVLFGS